MRLFPRSRRWVTIESPAHHFPRGRLWNRIVLFAERELASLPMVLITPMVAAITSATFAVKYSPAEHVRDGVVDAPSLVSSLLLAIAGALTGVLLVVVVLAVWFWGRYRFLLGPWVYSSGATGPSGSCFPLGLTFRDAGDPSRLGKFEAWVKLRHGCVVRCDDLGLAEAPYAWLFDLARPDPHDRELGRDYEVRWYLTPPDGPGYEILRTRVNDPYRIVGSVGASRS